VTAAAPARSWHVQTAHRVRSPRLVHGMGASGAQTVTAQKQQQQQQLLLLLCSCRH
jgi:hypothetical protein